MFKKWFIRSALILCLICMSAFSCSLTNLAALFPTSNPAITPTVEAVATVEAVESDFNTAIHELLHAEVQAFNHEDVAAYMATMHPDSPSYAVTESTLQTVFASYDLVVKMTLGDAVLLDNGDASIPFVLTTRRQSGADFQDNEITGSFILRLDGSEWKLYGQEILNTRNL